MLRANIGNTFSGCAAEARTLGIGPASELRVTGRALFPDSVESHGGIGEGLTLGGGGTWEVVRLGGTAQAPPHEAGSSSSTDNSNTVGVAGCSLSADHGVKKRLTESSHRGGRQPPVPNTPGERGADPTPFAGESDR